MKNLLKYSLFGISATFLFTNCGPQKTEEVVEEVVEVKTPTLTLLWETSDSLMTNESVLFDDATGTLYVSNIEGQDPLQKDGKGSIAIISKEGKILNPAWVTGLNAPKGMAISNGKLYVTDIDELVEIDIATAKVSNKWKVEGAQFLNDVAAHEGTVYFTDMNTGKVHVYAEGKISTISEGNTSINGIAIADDGTVYGLDGSGLKKWNWDGGTEIINSTITGGDGLVILGDGNFIASRWQGEIYFANDSTQTLMLDTKSAESNTADIGYNAAEKIVYVPTFFKNKVAAYKLDY
ncbi:SMP-30/gluconolactonase/LRE family protein [Algoriphagus sp. AK58]|uniref:SMP-30/gluconolactonase/LRE family protein n=1 Tax=Algoriphagus sp. AK58 TaxID=1406877 RepID=UPI001650B2F1|nr:ATP-binding protein [Algoriphagus sp. AK58]MBC6367144.1 ATP-binding protein [Algoriphagus sp. AK58]